MIRKLQIRFKYKSGIFENKNLEKIAEVIHRVLCKSDEHTEEINKLIDKAQKQDFKINELKLQVEKLLSNKL